MACLHLSAKTRGNNNNNNKIQLHWRLSLTMLIMLSTLGGCWGHLNLYLNSQEVMRLLGVSAEVYYVRDGHINNYALNFIVPVPANVRDISFTWQSQAGRPLPYSINVVTSDQAVLPRPTMNISQIGEIPIKVQTFSIGLKCSGIRAAEVDVTISIEVILNRALNNVTHLVFRRKKICLLAEEDETDMDDPLLLETVVPPPTGFITLVVGCVLALALVLILLLAAYCVRGSTKRQNHGGQPMRTSSFQRLNTNPPCQTASYITPSIIAPIHTTLPPSPLWLTVGPFCQLNVLHFYNYTPASLNFMLKLHVMCSSIILIHYTTPSSPPLLLLYAPSNGQTIKNTRIAEVSYISHADDFKYNRKVEGNFIRSLFDLSMDVFFCTNNENLLTFENNNENAADDEDNNNSDATSHCNRSTIHSRNHIHSGGVGGGIELINIAVKPSSTNVNEFKYADEFARNDVDQC
ncbi:Tyrosine-protein kinase Dnt [Lucilia cuprina]|nr:Tyrosine-protein kinase Dnt [Lucilia cuprina]KAI8119410.1 Tyrosine-protein kinase Dnt [Lucilia cuprina]